MPSGNVSFTDEYVTQQDLRAFTAPEVLEGVSLSSVSDIEKVNVGVIHDTKTAWEGVSSEKKKKKKEFPERWIRRCS